MNIRIPSNESNEKIHLNNSTKIFQVMQKIYLRQSKLRRNKEHFWIIGTNRSMHIQFIELVNIGNQFSTIVDFHAVFRIALQKYSLGLILVHNHPSGTCKPSDEDKMLTHEMIKTGKFMKIPIIDHIIISEDNYYSFGDNGEIQYLENTECKHLSEELETRLDIMQIESNTKYLIAEKLIKYSIPLKTVKAVTGLRKTQLNKLTKNLQPVTRKFQRTI